MKKKKFKEKLSKFLSENKETIKTFQDCFYETIKPATHEIFG